MPVPARRRLACLTLSLALVLAVGCSSGSTEAYCDEAAVVAGDNPAGVFAAWDPANPAAGDELTHAADRLHELADAAPAEIADDAGLIASTADDLAELLTDLQGDELDAALREREEAFTEVDEASRRLIDFTRTECGVDLEVASPTTTAPVGEATTTEFP